MSRPDPLHVLRLAFPDIPDQEAEALISSGRFMDYAPEAVLCREGEVEDTFFILVDGEVVVSKLIEADEVRLLKRLTPGDFFGEMALIHEAPRAATVMTSQPSTVLEINKEAFQTLLHTSSSVSMAMVREVSRRLMENDQMAIEDLRIKAMELAGAYQRLAEIELARREFLTTIAHELRTPLTAADGLLQVVRMGMLDGEALNETLASVARNLQRIITLVNDILFLQEMDLILIDFEAVDVGTVVAAAVEALRGKAARNRVGLQLDLAPDLPMVNADPQNLERACAAVIENGIKFSPDGGDVIVQVTSSATHVTLTVQDKGVGIAPDILPRIFERFFHVDRIDGHVFGGIGLGLSIALQVIEQHGGTIDVESREGEGSTFRVNIPVGQS